MCREAASFDLKAEDLAACIEALHVAAEIAASKRDQVLIEQHQRQLECAACCLGRSTCDSFHGRAEPGTGACCFMDERIGGEHEGEMAMLTLAPCGPVSRLRW